MSKQDHLDKAGWCRLAGLVTEVPAAKQKQPCSSVDLVVTFTYSPFIPLFVLSLYSSEFLTYIIFLSSRVFHLTFLSQQSTGDKFPVFLWEFFFLLHFFLFLWLHPVVRRILVPQWGAESTPPVLEGGVLTTGPPEKSPSHFWRVICSVQNSRLVDFFFSQHFRHFTPLS